MTTVVPYSDRKVVRFNSPDGTAHICVNKYTGKLLCIYPVGQGF